MKQRIITRFPPSPTGPIHIGNVRTALFNYLYAKYHGGQFILRIEDTDKARSKPEFEEGILESLSWLGLKHDGEVFRQSERGTVYKKYLDKLIAENKAYLSLEDEGENREVIRFKNPNQKIVFEDLVRGEVSFDTTELGDFIIARNKNEPLYHLAVVIDDFESGVTHVIRGEDHVSNTPRQILIQEALGAPRPIYAHLPLILASDRSKLSKRKHGESVSLDYYRKKGYLAEALINYLALLGWNPGTNEEIFTLEKLVKVFDIAKIQKGGAVFDERKLDWVNREHIKLLPESERRKLALKDFNLKAVPKLDKNKIAWKNVSEKETLEHLTKAKEIIESGGGEKEIMKYAESGGKARPTEHQPDRVILAGSFGRGNVLWPVRYALSGKDVSPDPFTLIAALGPLESVRRLDEAIKLLDNK
ncbi:MAG: glutamate--tRNA ligase [Minisyncoccia bacterium]